MTRKTSHVRLPIHTNDLYIGADVSLLLNNIYNSSTRIRRFPLDMNAARSEDMREKHVAANI